MLNNNNIDLQSLKTIAENDLQKAIQETFRPREDVVYPLVCQYTKQAIYRYLCCIIFHYKNILHLTRKRDTSLKLLINECNQYEKKLSNLNFSQMQCLDCADVLNSKNYCLNETQVNKCMQNAKCLKTLIESLEKK